MDMKLSIHGPVGSTATPSTSKKATPTVKLQRNNSNSRQSAQRVANVTQPMAEAISAHKQEAGMPGAYTDDHSSPPKCRSFFERNHHRTMPEEPELAKLVSRNAEMVWDEWIKFREGQTDIRPIHENGKVDYLANERKFKSIIRKRQEKDANDKLVAETERRARSKFKTSMPKPDNGPTRQSPALPAHGFSGAVMSSKGPTDPSGLNRPLALGKGLRSNAKKPQVPQTLGTYAKAYLLRGDDNEKDRSREENKARRGNKEKHRREHEDHFGEDNQKGLRWTAEEYEALHRIERSYMISSSPNIPKEIARAITIKKITVLFNKEVPHMAGRTASAVAKMLKRMHNAGHFNGPKPDYSGEIVWRPSERVESIQEAEEAEEAQALRSTNEEPAGSKRTHSGKRKLDKIEDLDEGKVTGSRHAKPNFGLRASTSPSKALEWMPLTKPAKKAKTRASEEDHEFAMRDMMDENLERQEGPPTSSNNVQSVPGRQSAIVGIIPEESRRSGRIRRPNQRYPSNQWTL